MITLLVSSKTMSSNAVAASPHNSRPLLIEQANNVNEALKKLTHDDLKRIMHISDNLALETAHKINRWSENGTTEAWYAFTGDVYKGLKIAEFSSEDLKFAQEHCRTLSGIYGILKPLDKIMPYRLELGYKLKLGGKNNLYEFWADSIANTLPENEQLINLASEEYIKVIRPYTQDRVITPVFLQTKNNSHVFQAFHAKVARGTMARWICKNKINDPTMLTAFTEEEYRFNKQLSTPQKPVFIRSIN